MNKTLLLIICDFLLLNLLALTRWDKVDQVPAGGVAAPEVSANAAAAKRQDLLDVMKMSLTDERSEREQLAQQLLIANKGATNQDMLLAQLRADRVQLEGTVSQNKKSIDELNQKFSEAARVATLTKEQLDVTARALDTKRSEAEAQAAKLGALERQQQEAMRLLDELNVAYKVAEAEKKMLASNLTQMRTEVDIARVEKAKAVEHAETLAKSLGKIATTSSELTKEIRENRGQNANTLFNDFLTNRVQTSISAMRPGMINDVNRNKEAATVLVQDGAQVYALLHVQDTPFSFSEFGADWTKFDGYLLRPTATVNFRKLAFHAYDPRVVVVPVSPQELATLKAKVYPIATNALKFKEAVLISKDGKYYGETEFLLDPSKPLYVKMKTKIFSRMFGEFAPKTGDLVFTKSGELLGMMVNREFCAVINNIRLDSALPIGEPLANLKTGPVLEGLRQRILALAPELQ